MSVYMNGGTVTTTGKPQAIKLAKVKERMANKQWKKQRRRELMLSAYQTFWFVLWGAGIASVMYFLINWIASVYA
jgi:type VI protein secretion system component VasF